MAVLKGVSPTPLGPKHPQTLAPPYAPLRDAAQALALAHGLVLGGLGLVALVLLKKVR